MRVLLMGYAIGLALGGVITIVAVTTRFGTDLLSTLTAMFNPLPAIALLPLALLWFGLGAKPAVRDRAFRAVGGGAQHPYGLHVGVARPCAWPARITGCAALRYVVLILIPAAFPSILTGLKIGWAFAWRTLIAAELVFGVAAGPGGLGWFIFENRNQLEMAMCSPGCSRSSSSACSSRA